MAEVLRRAEGLGLKKIVALASLGLVVIATLVASGKLFEHNAANTTLVVQSPIKGTLTVHFTPGMKWQGFGTVTFYEKRAQYSFSAKASQGSKHDESLPVQFADGGKAKVSGVISWEMPVDEKGVIQIHTLYGSQVAVEQQLVRPAVERSLYLTGTLLTSAEAYASRKAEFLSAFEDQVKFGIYQMETISEKRPDPITGQEKTVQIVRIMRDKATNVPLRSSESPLKQFNISILPPAIDDIDFDKTVKDQIAEQQKAIMQVMTAQAKAREAEQKYLTITKEGEANAADAKWKQEVVKAQQVTESEMKVLVAQNAVKAAELNKRAKILDGEGEAEARKLVMNADGALAVKIEAYKHVQDRWAQAFENFKGQLVPQVVTGGQGVQGNAAINFMELMGIKAAKDLVVAPAPGR